LNSDFAIYQKLYEIGKNLNEKNSINDVFSIATNFATENLGFEKALIFKHDEKNGWFKVAYSVGYDNPMEQKILKIINLLLSGEVIETLRVSQKPIIHTAICESPIVNKLSKSLFLKEAYFELFGGDTKIPFGLIVVGNSKNLTGFPISATKTLALGNFITQFSNTINNIIFYKAWEDEKALLEKNITKRTEEINLQKETFEAIYKTLKDGIAILDVETTAFLDVNEAYGEITGYSIRELLRLSCLKLSVPEDLARSRNVLKEVLEVGYMKNFIRKCFKKDGSIIIVSMSATLMSDKKRMIVSLKDITELEEQKSAIEKAHKDMKDSIKFASLIQTAILPETSIVRKYTKDSFIFWKPKDTVGGDIYLVIELPETEEIFILVYDGAGHSVHGAFVTMLIKAIENELSIKLHNREIERTPSAILEFFNKSFKTMLRQDKRFHSRKENIANIGFDGGVIYYKQGSKKISFSGAKTCLYVTNHDEIQVVKSDRVNVGFFRTKMEYKFSEETIEISKNTKIYIATDGFQDQFDERVGENYGKSRFKELIYSIKDLAFIQQQKIIENELENIIGSKKQIDDITIMGIEF
jgi:PAS domain S-box-containing protein